MIITNIITPEFFVYYVFIIAFFLYIYLLFIIFFKIKIFFAASTGKVFTSE